MYVLGLDIGTTGTKAVLVDAKGNLCETGYSGYSLITQDRCIEQDPEDWWRASCIAIAQACTGKSVADIAALSISAQGASMVALTAEGQPIGNAITWLDSRATQETDQIEAELGEAYIYHSTGWRLSPSLDAAKILYMRHNPQYEKARWFVSTLEYINHKLTGRLVIDPTCAGIRQLYNIDSGTWNARILQSIGCTQDALPEICPTGTFLGNLCASAAKALGLHTGVKVYNGAHDQYCASLGSGAIHCGDMLLSTGTAWAVMGISRDPIRSSTYIASCRHPVEDLYGNMVSLTGAGTAYQWIKDKFFDEISFAHLDELCATRIGKTKNLIFLPWLSGNLYPYYMGHAKGGFLGADLSTDRFDFALSVMESAAFAVRATIEDFEAHSFPVQKILAMGGAVKSGVWMDILQSIVKKPVHRLNIPDACALGAASIALIQEGAFPSFGNISEKLVESKPVVSALNQTQYFEEKYDLYRRITTHMASFYQNYPE